MRRVRGSVPQSLLLGILGGFSNASARDDAAPALTQSGAVRGARGWPVAAADSLPLSQIAQISPAGYQQITFGDTDHDGLNEVILYWLDQDSNCCFYHILEDQGTNAYSLVYSGARLVPYATGDLDLDGKSEIIGKSGYQLRVYESVDAASYPTQLVWSVNTTTNSLGHTSVADTDRDGQMEIIHDSYSGGYGYLIIYESAGDNSYDLVLSRATGPGGNAELVIADLDGDGLTEIAFASAAYGRVHVYESPADDTWVETWTDSTELWNAFAAEGGRDTDGNGRPEVFVTGNTNIGMGVYWRTIVYEASGDNQFARVATLTKHDGFSGMAVNALGNLDGLGAADYIMSGGCCFWIYRATAPGQWQVVQQVLNPDGLHGGLFPFDVNRNDRDEVFWTTSADFNYTLVLEYPYRVSDVGENLHPRVAALKIYPNPCRLEASLRFPGATPGVGGLAVYDVAGHLLERRMPLRDASGQLLWPVRHLNPGIYFVRLENGSGSTLAIGRAVVVH